MKHALEINSDDDSNKYDKSYIFECDKKYKNKSSLRLHNRIHSGISYECNLCGIIYKQKHTLDNHIKKKH